MHATVMTYSQNKNRRIKDLSMYVYEYKRRDSDDNRGYDRKKVKLDVYQPLPCKILARTSRQYIAQDGITMNGTFYPAPHLIASVTYIPSYR